MPRDYVDAMSRGFADELQKLAGGSKLLIPAAAGSLLTLAALKANKDRALGKQIRLQQGQG